MSPATRATALMLAAFVAAFLTAAVAAYYLALREPAPSRPARAARPACRHLKAVRHRRAPRHEWLLWAVSLAIRFYRSEDGAAKSATVLASLFVAFSFVIGANQ